MIKLNLYVVYLDCSSLSSRKYLGIFMEFQPQCTKKSEILTKLLAFVQLLILSALKKKILKAFGLM
jgi:hypothetical protein